MMSELYELLKELKIPIAYHHFGKSTSPPFITYYRANSQNFVADDSVYKKIDVFRIELYTKQKDIAKEIELENLLDRSGNIYEVISENYIESEKIYQVIYELDI